MADEDPVLARYEGTFTRLRCGYCDELFEIEEDVSNGEMVDCDMCGTEQEVEGR